MRTIASQRYITHPHPKFGRTVPEESRYWKTLIEWSDHKRSWATVGVSENVIEASWQALLDAIRLELMRLTESEETVEATVEDYSWGV